MAIEMIDKKKALGGGNRKIRERFRKRNGYEAWGFRLPMLMWRRFLPDA